MTIPIVWLSYRDDTPGRGYWDMGMLEGLFSGDLWHAVGKADYRHLKTLDGITDGAIIVFPARAQVDYVDRLNADIKKLRWVIIMVTGDEEASFPFDKLKHPNMKLWVMSPRRLPRYEGVRFLGTGYPPQAKEHLAAAQINAYTRGYDWMFAGQITHERRRQMAAKLLEMQQRDDMYGEYLPSEGFTQGVEPLDYYAIMAASKIAICPSGPQTPDSFRLFEALEAGCIPIADTRIPSDMPNDQFGDDYWTWFFGEEPPFPVITDYDQLPGYTLEALHDWTAKANRVGAWWMKKKRQMAYWLEQDLIAVEAGGREELRPEDMITVLIPSSPIQAHPDTAMIEQCIRDVRSRLPKAEIIIMLDGVRAEQEAYRPDYEQYVNRVIWLCQNQWQNVLPVVFDEHMHQASMTRVVLEQVATPCILFVEHDAPITPDADFDWMAMCDVIMNGEANVIRFLHEALILPDYAHLMLAEEVICGVPLTQTIQWSQRPHLASTAWYRNMISNYFNPASHTMIEDVVHGLLMEDYKKDGIMGWYNWRVYIYSPEGNKKRSYHLDGRQTDPKYEMDIKPVEPKQ